MGRLSKKKPLQSDGFTQGSTGPDPVKTAQLANKFASQVEAALKKQELEDEQHGQPSAPETAETKTAHPSTPIMEITVLYPKGETMGGG